MGLGIPIAILLLIGINLHAGDIFSFPFEMTPKNFTRYFKEPRPQPVTVTFRLSYSPQKNEREVFSLENLELSPATPVPVIDRENDQPLTGEVAFNGPCFAVRISPESPSGEKIYSVTTIFCWVFPAKKLIFEEMIAWNITVAGNKIISGTQGKVTGGSQAWTVSQFWNVNDRSADFIRMIIKAGWDPNRGVRSAITGSRPEVLDVLLANGAEVNRPDQHTFTPLIWAANTYATKPEVFETLFRHHADANITDKHQNNALMWAARNRRPAEIIRLLASRTDDLNLQATTGFTLMGELLQYADAKLLLELIAKGAKLKVSEHNAFSLVKDSDKLKALLASPEARQAIEEQKALVMTFALAVNLDSARYLHRLGWEWSRLQVPPNGSPVLLGCALGTADNLKFMVDELGYSIPTGAIRPLAVAVAYRNYSTTKFLLERGADPIIRNNKEQIIKEYKTSPEIEALLKEYTERKLNVYQQLMDMQ